MFYMNMAYKFLKENYNYVYLKSRLNSLTSFSDGINLVVGSSHSLNGIDSYCDNSILNLSMHSQDIYYDCKFVKEVILNKGIKNIKNIIFMFGYYIMYQDLSRSINERNNLIDLVYFPLFADGHNVDYSLKNTLWDAYDIKDDNVKKEIEYMACDILKDRKNYYNEFRNRTPFFDFKGKAWRELDNEERLQFGQARASMHNKILKYKDSFDENKKCLEDTIKIIKDNMIDVYFIIPPFSDEYNKYVSYELKSNVTNYFLELEEVKYIDFNMIESVVEMGDFVDTDHMNGRGAYKFTKTLFDEFICK